MIPKIKKLKTNKYPYNQGTYMVIGDHGIDLVDTYLDAIRYWLWHCGVPAKYCFRKYKKYDKNSEKTRLDVESK